LRLLCAKKFNPSLVDNITLLLDGHHNRIVYQNVFLDKKELYSWKLKKNGLNTQFLIDVNKMCIYVSDSLPCKMNNDDNMFLNINLNNFYSETDCICFDGLYENTLDEFIDKYKNIGYNISLQNFCFPIKKTKNIDLLEDEIKFNDILGGFRSKIESYFAELGSVFKRFSGQTKVRITESKIYNIQLKLAIVLLNIKYFKELFNLEEVNHYNKWRIDNFDYSYSNNIELNLDVSLKTKYKVEEINNIKNLQLDFINKLKIGDKNNNILDIDKCSESMEVEEEVYEVQYIIKHKKVLSNYEYYVKWRNYGKEKNSWVKDTDFTETTIIFEYWSSISRK
jgi:stringent starvation protein B